MKNYKIDDKCAKELKQLSKKYKNLKKDLAVFCQTHKVANDTSQDEVFRRNFFAGKMATVLRESADKKIKIVKARLYSTDLKNSQNLRAIYCFSDSRLTLIEIYSKSSKSVEDKSRWRPFCPTKATD